MKTQAEMWSSTPLDGRTLYVVFWRKRVFMASKRTYRKYYTGRAGFTENRYLAWKTDDRAAAERVASTIPGGLVAEWNQKPARSRPTPNAAQPQKSSEPV